MGTNYYLIEKTESDKSKINDKIKTLAQETITKLRELVDISRHNQFQVEQAITDNQIERNKIHIGKNTYGWRFTFSSAPIGSIANLETIFNSETFVIEDEYDRELSLSEMKEIIIQTLSNPKRNTKGEEIPESSEHSDYAEFTSEGFTLMKGEFS